MPLPLRLSAATVQEALDRADQRHWTRNPPRSPRARLAFLLQQAGGDQTALATRLDVPAHELDTLRTVRRPSEDDPVQQAVERDIIRLWQPRIRRRAHTAILHNNGQMMVSFRAWLGFTAAAGSSDDPRLRFLTLSLQAPYIERLFTARHRNAPRTSCAASSATLWAPATSTAPDPPTLQKPSPSTASTTSSSTTDRAGGARTCGQAPRPVGRVGTRGEDHGRASRADLQSPRPCIEPTRRQAATPLRRRE
ncbi:telomere-protecting terminal protein Tpg [Streptomyces ipomoeae]|uniref:telomere-protecting terminal protein Tpg n=1 Tax=Streptomyces ipomoeae TaxID=103232 RepID=UPI003DA763B0